MIGIATIEEHPYATAGVVFVVGAALVLYLRSGSAPQSAQASYLDDSSQVAAGTALQQSQIAAGAQANQLQTQLQAQQDTNATNLGIAQLAASVQMNGQNVQADTINKQTQAGVDVAHFQYDSQNYANSLVATTTQQQQQLTADTTQKSTALAAAVQEAQFAAQTQQETLLANAYSDVAGFAYQTTVSNNQTQLAEYAASAATAYATTVSNNQTQLAEYTANQATVYQTTVSNNQTQLSENALNDATAYQTAFLNNQTLLAKYSIDAGTAVYNANTALAAQQDADNAKIQIAGLDHATQIAQINANVQNQASNNAVAFAAAQNSGFHLF